MYHYRIVFILNVIYLQLSCIIVSHNTSEKKNSKWPIYYFLETILAIFWIIKKLIAPLIYSSLVNISVSRLLSK